MLFRIYYVRIYYSREGHYNMLWLHFHLGGRDYILLFIVWYDSISVYGVMIRYYCVLYGIIVYFIYGGYGNILVFII